MVERSLCTVHICCGGPQRKSIFPEERSDQEMIGVMTTLFNQGLHRLSALNFAEL